MSWDEEPAVVLDNGSGIVKGGFAGDEQPRSIFASVVGTGRGPRKGETVLGDAALGQAGLTLRYPVEHGVVQDWDGMERLWRHMYSELGADPGRQAALVTEAPLNPLANREKAAEILFESVGVPALQFQIQAVLALYSSGRVTALVLDSGDGVTHAVPVFEGHATPTAIRRLELAGRDLTEWMMDLLGDELGRPFTTTADREVARRVKEQLCYVADDFDAAMAEAEDGGATAAFELPDGQSVDVGRARFACPELLFDPALGDKPGPSLQRTVVDAVQACAVDTRRTLLHNIVLSGGSTMFRDMEHRLQREVAGLCNERVRDEVRVVAAGERKYSVWMGAAILASLSSFGAEWIAKEDYDEAGPAVLHRRSDALGFAGK